MSGPPSDEIEGCTEQAHDAVDTVFEVAMLAVVAVAAIGLWVVLS